jgi:hypothetical protein
MGVLPEDGGEREFGKAGVLVRMDLPIPREAAFCRAFFQPDPTLLRSDKDTPILGDLDLGCQAALTTFPALMHLVQTTIFRTRPF